jgi:hypothetical protein
VARAGFPPWGSRAYKACTVFTWSSRKEEGVPRMQRSINPLGVDLSFLIL